MLELCGMLLVLCYLVEVIGAILAWVVFVFIVATNQKRYSAAQRLGYELYAWIALMDWCNNMVGLLSYDNDFAYGAMSAVSLNPGVLKFFDMLQKNFNSAFVMLTVCMAFNLHMVFLRHKYLDNISHWRYAKWAIGLSMLIPLPHFIFSVCMRQHTPLDRYWKPLGEMEQWVHHYIWQALGTIYCLYVFISVSLRLRKKRIRVVKLAKLPTADGNNTVTMERFASRLILYAVVPVLTQLPTFILRIFTNQTTLVFLILLSNLSSILNFLCFLFDPALHSIYQEWRLRKYPPEPQGYISEDTNPLIWRI
ncbi:hypothetical protein DSO57_1011771 [Entomophthora muscae]|uniref:Uncharacterized protein n=1 Tax=Entomophthora muscae TaxID=34485 RepID=A0ACC2SVC4_9FUNG|nr:hypothetical protein DSO57_1011771 [Entomophthora muscae]